MLGSGRRSALRRGGIVSILAVVIATLTATTASAGPTITLVWDGSVDTPPVVVGNHLFIFQGDVLWYSDGTTEGTTQIATFASSPYHITAAAGSVYFTATDGTHGYELWRSDGTSAGTGMVKDIRPGANSAEPSGMTAVGSLLYFGATDGVHGYELWRTDGTPSGTRMVKDVNPHGNGGGAALTVLNPTTMLFHGNDGVHGWELWRTDGTRRGTWMVKDIQRGKGDGHIESMTRVGKKALFSASDGPHGLELWRSDGTRDGTHLVKDAYPGKGSSIMPWEKYAMTDDIVRSGTKVFYMGDDGVHGWEPWVSDGTKAGTHMVKNIQEDVRTDEYSWVGPSIGFAANKLMYFTEWNRQKPLMWRSDGTTAGTFPLNRSGPRNMGELTRLGDAVYLTANDDAHGEELWTTDGTVAGTHLFADLSPGPTGSRPYLLTAGFGHLFVFADVNGLYGLYRLDP